MLIEVPRKFVGKNFCIYSIDTAAGSGIDYSGVSDMHHLHCLPDGSWVVLTVCLGDPSDWASENLGGNECPIAYVSGHNVKRDFFHRDLRFKFGA